MEKEALELFEKMYQERGGEECISIINFGSDCEKSNAEISMMINSSNLSSKEKLFLMH